MKNDCERWYPVHALSLLPRVRTNCLEHHSFDCVPNSVSITPTLPVKPILFVNRLSNTMSRPGTLERVWCVIVATIVSQPIYLCTNCNPLQKNSGVRLLTFHALPPTTNHPRKRHFPVGLSPLLCTIWEEEEEVVVAEALERLRL